MYINICREGRTSIIRTLQSGEKKKNHILKIRKIDDSLLDSYQISRIPTKHGQKNKNHSNHCQ